jgi:hypothetical protein
MQKWLSGVKKTYCKKISYAQGYAPPPGQDPCTAKATSTGSTATG